MIAKTVSAVRIAPKSITDLTLPVTSVTARPFGFRPPNAANSGLIQLFATAVTAAVNAVPRITATDRWITLLRKKKSLNPLIKSPPSYVESRSAAYPLLDPDVNTFPQCGSPNNRRGDPLSP